MKRLVHRVDRYGVVRNGDVEVHSMNQEPPAFDEGECQNLFAHLLGPCVSVSWLFKPIVSAERTAVGYDVLVSFRR